MIGKFFEKAIKLELVHLRQNLPTLLLLAILPFAFLSVFAMAMGAQHIAMEKGTTLYDFYAPLVFATLAFFVGLQGTILRIVGERSPYGALDRDLLAINRVDAFIARAYTGTIYVAVTAIVITIIALLVFPLKIAGSFLLIPLMVFLVGVFGVVAGLLLSALLRSKYVATQIAPLIVLTSILTSELILPEMPLEIKHYLAAMPLNLAIQGISLASFSEGFGLLKALSLIGSLLSWIFGVGFLGILKFGIEDLGEIRKNAKAYAAIAAISIFVVGGFFLLSAKNWETMQIDDFKIYGIKTFVGNYPHTYSLEKIEKSIPAGMLMENAEYYEWLLKDQKAAAAFVAELHEPLPLNEETIGIVFPLIKPKFAEFAKKYNLSLDPEKLKITHFGDEQVFAYSEKIVADGKEYEVMAYFFAKERFVFGIVGLKQLADKIATEAIAKFPAN